MFIHMGIDTSLPFWAWSAPDAATKASRAPEKLACDVFLDAWGISLAPSGPDRAQKGNLISEVSV